MFARDLHTIRPRPLKRTVWRQFAAQRGDIKKEKKRKKKRQYQIAPFSANITVIIIIFIIIIIIKIFNALWKKIV